MTCFYPVQDPKYGLRPCGQCAACMVQKHLQWKFRLSQEILFNDLALWCTLQYNDEHLIYVNDRPAVSKEHCQNFFHKLRRSFDRKELKVTFKYFLVSEYGPKTNRPHYHVLLLFKLPPMEIEPMLELRQWLYEEIRCRWYHGFAKVDLFHSGVIRYLTKYVFKPYDGFDPPVPCFRLISKGIGEDYLQYLDKDEIKKLETWKTPEGVLPRYYRDKLFPTLHGGYYSNIVIRDRMNSNTMDKIYNKALQEERKFSSLEEFMKYQAYMLRCQKRLVERKQNLKYG